MKLADLVRRIQGGEITAADMEALINDDSVDPADPRAPARPTPRGEVVLHKLNGVTVTRVVDGRGAQTHFTYEVAWREHFIADRDAKYALARMRHRFPKPAQHRSGEILALRVWNLIGDCLTPVTREDSFDGPIAASDKLPGIEDSFGLHAIKMTPSNLNDLIQSYHPHAYGFVGVFGTVVEHEDGYRSSKQIIRRIILRFPASAAYVKLLADRYECEVIVEKRFRR